jgi:hypothetical protein
MARRLLRTIALASLAGGLAACSGAAATPTLAPTPAPTAAPSPTAAPTPISTLVPSAAPSEAASAGETGSAADAYPFLEGYQGTFKGSWNNTTFGSTGSMTWIISADPASRRITIDVTVGGNFFGGSGAPGETIILTHLATGTIRGTSPAFGDISGTITPDGRLTITLKNISGGLIKQVDVTGSFTGGDTIAIDYSVTFTAGGAKAAGKVKLLKS